MAIGDTVRSDKVGGLRALTEVTTTGGDQAYSETVSVGASTAEIGRVNQIMFNVAGDTLTRPANTTAYSANDAVSNNATPASVTATRIAGVSDENSAPVMIEEIALETTDTGPGTASARFRLYVYRSDPTASSGIAGGDNAAFSAKKAGFVGSFVGTFLPFSDGSFAVMVPESDGAAGGGVRICNPSTGGKDLWYVLQTLTAFTPSGNSTTFAPRFKGWQGRLAA